MAVSTGRPSREGRARSGASYPVISRRATEARRPRARATWDSTSRQEVLRNPYSRDINRHPGRESRSESRVPRRTLISCILRRRPDSLSWVLPLLGDVFSSHMITI